MKVLVTGASGFIGCHIVEELTSRGHEVHSFVRKTSKTDLLERLDSQLCYGDVCEPSTLDAALSRGVDAVVHNAGCIAARNREKYYDVNQHGTANLLSACVKASSGLSKFVLISSQAAAGPSSDGTPLLETGPHNPITNYGKSKLKGEEEVLEYRERFPVVILRPSVVYGPGDRSTFPYFKIIDRYRLKPYIRRGDTLLNIVYVKDLARGIAMALEKETVSGDIFFMSRNPPVTLLQILDLIAKESRKRVVPLPIPGFAVRGLSGIIEFLNTRAGTGFILNREKGEEMLQRYWVVDTRRAEEVLGFTARTPPEEGIPITFRWYREKGWI